VHVRKEASGSARLQLLRLSQTKPCLNFINEFMLCCSAASVCTKRFCRISYLQRWHLLFYWEFCQNHIGFWDVLSLRCQHADRVVHPV
jgi:hypothetical protein